MPVLLQNNATSRLATSISSSDTTISVMAGEGARFPQPVTGNWFPVTLIKSDGSLEICKCTDRSTDILTVERAQENTTANTFSAGDRIELRLTKAALQNATADYAGPNEPSDPSPYMTWADTANGLLKRRNAANTAWVAEGYLFTPPPPGKNLLINGGFIVNQRSPAQTISGYGSVDRWYNDHAGATKTMTWLAFNPGQTDVPGEPATYVSTVIGANSGSTDYVRMQQRIERVRTAAGQKVAFSFWAKGSAALNIGVSCDQFFGLGGSPSSAVPGIGQKFVLGTVWQRFTGTIDIPSISGKTIGTDDPGYLAFNLWLAAGSSLASQSGGVGNQAGTIEITLVKLEIGSVATPFQAKTYDEEFQACRYYYRVVDYDMNFSPTGVNTPVAGCHYILDFQPPMRVPPTTASAAFTNGGGLNTAYTTRSAKRWTANATSTTLSAVLNAPTTIDAEI